MSREYGLKFEAHEGGVKLIRHAEKAGFIYGFEKLETIDPGIFLKEGDMVRFGNSELSVVETPGHADGSVCFISHSDKFVILLDRSRRPPAAVPRSGRTTDRFAGADHVGTVGTIPRLAHHRPDTTVAATGNASETKRAPEAENPGLANGGTEIAPKANRSFGVLHAVIAVVIGGALTALFWSKSGDHPVTPAAKPSPVAAMAQKPTPAYIPQQAAPTAQPVASAAPVNKEAAAPLVQIEPARKAKPQQAALAVTGTYEVTRGTRVFAAPTEFSQQVGEIEPVLKVNVVNARDGWLEIHSKHGRPPGFIRSDAAARVGG